MVLDEIEKWSAWIKKENEQIQTELKNSYPRTDMGVLPEPALSRIEKQLSEIHCHTEELIRRVPENLSPLLVELRRILLEKINSSREKQSAQGNESILLKANQITKTIQKLTPQERKLFELCLRSGLITYQELADHLGVSLITARGIVNRAFQNIDKSKLFRKKRRDGFIGVELTETVERTYRRKQPNSSDKNDKFSVKIAKAYSRSDFGSS